MNSNTPWEKKTALVYERISVKRARHLKLLENNPYQRRTVALWVANMNTFNVVVSLPSVTRWEKVWGALNVKIIQNERY